MPVLFRDIETRSTCDLKACGAHRYAADPTTEVMCVGYGVDSEPIQIWVPGDAIPVEFTKAAASSSWSICAHNDAFETVIEQHILAPRFGWPLVPIERHRCTMAVANAAALPGSLDKAIEALGLPYPKDKVGQALMRRMTKPLPGGGWIEDAASREQLYAYCKKDVEAERALFRALPPLTTDEQRVWELDATINARGFYTDGTLLDAAAHVVTTAGATLQAEFYEITGLSTNQVKKFIGWLAGHDCVVADVQKGTLKHALRRKGLTAAVRRALELRLELAHASAAKVEALRTWRGDDGRVRGTLKYHGAGPGRWTGHGPQPQNFKRDTENLDAKIAAVMNGGNGLSSPVEAVGDIARAMICAAPGHRLLIADFSGIESRVLAWISGQQSKVDAWAQFDRTGRAEDDPYVRIAHRCGLTGEGARDIGKRIDLAFGFGGSVGAWQRSAPENDATDERTAKRYRDTWRAEHRETVKFWYSLDRAAMAAMRRPGTAFPVGRVSYRFDAPFLRLTLPSGRAISYPFARIAGTDKFGRPQLTFLDNAGGKFVECRFGQGAWFGMLVENVVQAIARDLLAGALMRLEVAHYRPILHVHDEVVCEVPDSFGSIEEFQQIITTAPSWADGLPIAAKVRNGPRFCKINTPAPESTTAAEPPQPQVGFLGGAEVVAGSSKRMGELPITSLSEHNPAAGPPVRFSATAPIVTMRMTNGGATNSGNDSSSTSWADEDYGAGEHATSPTTATYIYRRADGSPFMRVRRTANKNFPTDHWTNGHWVKGWPARPFLPYRLPELTAALPNVSVFSPEGEKDCERLAALGLIATCNSGGASKSKDQEKSKWWPELNEHFKGKQLVFVLEDNDEPGRLLADAKMRALTPIVPEVVRVRFPELLDGGDVSDWLDQLNPRTARASLLARCEQARKHNAAQQTSQPWQYHSEAEPAPTRWLIKNILPETGAGLIAGQWGTYKTTIALDVAVSVMTEFPLADRFKVNRQGAVIYIAPEGASGLASRLMQSHESAARSAHCHSRSARTVPRSPTPTRSASSRPWSRKPAGTSRTYLIFPSS